MYYYDSAFNNKYGDEEIRRIFSPMTKFNTWRKLWYVLASTQQKLGVPISNKAIEELYHALSITDDEMRIAQIYEKDTQHDVVAHILTLGDVCPLAKPYIHLGATSCYITDNTDIILMNDALLRISNLLQNVIENMLLYGSGHSHQPTVGYTHYQPAQLTTVGRRFVMWADGFRMDMDDVSNILNNTLLLGCKGAVGTYSGMLPVLGSYDRCVELNYHISNALGFAGCVEISGQTYNRKHDSKLMSVLSGIAQSAYKFAQDIRLLAHDGEIYEARGEKQVGSSAMPYKNNPIICERICGISRYVITMTQNFDHTAAVQWLERSLDDSSNRRITIAEIFLAVSEILILVDRVLNNLVINIKVINKHVRQQLPNAMSEHLMAEGVLAGGDRQEIHEKIRTGDTKDMERMIMDDALTMIKDEVSDIAHPMRYVGCAPEQTLNYVNSYWRAQR